MGAPNWFETIQLWFGALVADLRHNWKPKLKRVRLHLFAFALFSVGILEAVDPYALQAMLPERWGSLVFFAFGGLMWLLRKATSHPPVVTTTFYAESSVTEPFYPDSSTNGASPAAAHDEHALHRLADDGGPVGDWTKGEY